MTMASNLFFAPTPSPYAQRSASAVVSGRVATNRMARGKVRGKGEQAGSVVEDVRGNRGEN